MSVLTRQNVPPSARLLTRILERPGLVAAVRALPGAVLGKLIDRIGLEDAGELVALASTEQLERIFDDDLWQADGAGDDETFRPERFALWLRVMLEADEAALVRRLCELPLDLVALAVHRLVLVLDMDVLAEHLHEAGDGAEPIERALEASVFEEWEELRLIARDPDAWDDVWNALLLLDREHHDRLREILEQCCAMSTEYISGQGGLFQVLTSEEMLESDTAAARDDRRVVEGFISAADARAFLELARRGAGGEERDAITQAYFRALDGRGEGRATPDATGGNGSTPDENAEGATSKDISELAALLREADVVASGGMPLLSAITASSDGTAPAGHTVAPIFERAMSDLRGTDPECFSARVRELGYLVNVWMARASHEGRRPRPIEAMETVLRVCEDGLRGRLADAAPPGAREAVAVLRKTPADLLFRRGFVSATAAPVRQSGVGRRRR